MVAHTSCEGQWDFLHGMVVKLAIVRSNRKRATRSKECGSQAEQRLQEKSDLIFAKCCRREDDKVRRQGRVK